MESTWGSHQGTSIFFPRREYGVNKSLNSRGRSPIPRWTSTSSNWSRRTTKRRWVRHRRPVKHFFTEYLLPFFFCFTPVSVRPSWYHVSSSVFCFIISEPIIRKKRVPFSLLNRTESQGGASHACCLVKSCTWFFVIGRNLFFLDRSSISIRVSVLYHLDIVSLPPSARRPQLGGPRRFLFLFFPLHEHSKGTAFISNLISIYETFLWTLFNWNQSWIHLVFYSPAPIETSSSKRSMESSWSKPFSSHLSLSENGWKIPSSYPYGYPCGGNGGS